MQMEKAVESTRWSYQMAMVVLEDYKVLHDLIINRQGFVLETLVDIRYHRFVYESTNVAQG
jgi:hypothetical protein